MLKSKAKKNMIKSNKNHSVTLLLVFLCALLSVYGFKILAVQNLYVSLEDISEHSTMIAEEELYLGELRTLKEQYLMKLNEYYNNKNTGSKSKEQLNEEINKYKEKAGFTALKGEGVIVIIDDGIRNTVDDSENPTSLIVHDVDVRKLVNDLDNAGAEAVSVNGNRMLPGLSEVVCNGPTIRINGEQQARPYVIKAIGDRFEMSRALTDPDCYGVTLMKYGIQYEVLTKTEMQIEEYKGASLFRYASESED